ncbi:MoaD/ThiS family protein [Chloroflexota bacterium]
MSIKINIPYVSQYLADGVKVAEVNGSTVGECLNDLVARYPAIKKALFDDEAKLLSYAEIYINKESAHPDELTKPVSDGDEITIVLMFEGG